VNARESMRRQSALMFAAAANRPEAIRLLAARGADLDAASKVVHLGSRGLDLDGNPVPDGGAASRVNLLELKARPRSEGFEVLATVVGGLAPLHYAAREGHREAVRALLAAGADINRLTGGERATPLVMSVINGHFDLAMELVERGANPNIVTRDGMSALYAVLEARWAPVSWAPIAATDSNGIAAQRTGHLDLMKALLDSGADPDAALTTRRLWFSPLHHDQQWVKCKGSTPFWRAAQASDLPAMKLLVARGADAGRTSATNETPLMMAAGVGWTGNFHRNHPDGFLPAVKYLVEEAGAAVNAADADGYTALMGAAYRGDDEMVRYLVNKGAKLDPRTKLGWSVTDMANSPALRQTSVPTPHPKTVALLRSLGAPDPIKVADEEILGIIARKIGPTGAERPAVAADR
jgi:ankyrin repeat protein